MRRLVEPAPAAAAELATARLRLRAWQDADLEGFAALNADPEVMRHFPAPLDRAESDLLAARIRRKFAAQGWGLWAVELRRQEVALGTALEGGPAAGLFLGFVGLNRPDFDAPFTPCVEIGWRLARGAWGRGYATEAARAALEFAFRWLDLEEVVSFTAAGNLRSRAVMRRLGMARDPAEDFDHPALPNGHPLRRHVLYRLAAP